MADARVVEELVRRRHRSCVAATRVHERVVDADAIHPRDAAGCVGGPGLRRRARRPSGRRPVRPTCPSSPRCAATGNPGRDAGRPASRGTGRRRCSRSSRRRGSGGGRGAPRADAHPAGSGGLEMTVDVDDRHTGLPCSHVLTVQTTHRWRAASPATPLQAYTADRCRPHRTARARRAPRSTRRRSSRSCPIRRFPSAERIVRARRDGVRGGEPGEVKYKFLVAVVSTSDGSPTALELEDPRRPTAFFMMRPRYVAGALLLLWTGRCDDAIAVLDALRAEMFEHGEESNPLPHAVPHLGGDIAR